MKRRLLTGAVLALLISAAAQAAPERHPLVKALDYDTNLLLVMDLRLSNRQLVDLMQAAQVASGAGAAHEAAHASSLNGKAEPLGQEYKALAEGTELPEAQATVLADLRDTEAQRRQQLYGVIDGQVRRLRRSLMPDQAALVNWSHPGDAPGTADDAVAVEEMRLLASRLSEAGRFIERLRYVIPTDYIQTHVARIGEYLQAYVRPNTAQFEANRDWITNLMADARAVDEKDWPQQAPLFASQLLQHLGLLDKTGQGAVQQQAKYNWWDAYYLLTDPQTPEMLQALMAARGAAATLTNPPPDNNNQPDAGGN